MLSLRYSTIMYFVFLTNAVAAYLMPLDLVKDERLVLVRNGEKIEFLAAPEFCSSFDSKIFSSGNLSSHSCGRSTDRQQ
jgi:hypothetical protein